MKFIMHFFFIQHLLFNLAMGQDKVILSDIYVDFKDVKGLESSELNLMRKNAYEAIFSTKRFKINLSPKNIKNKSITNYYVVDIKIVEINRNDFDMAFRLKDEVSGDLINFVKSDSVSISKLQFQSRKMFYKLFYGEYYDEVEDKLISPKLIPLKKDPNEKIKRESILREKKERVKSDKNEDLEKSSEPEKPEGNKITEVKKSELKKEIKNKMPLKIANYASPNIYLEKKEEQTKKKDVNSLIWLSNSNYGFGVQNEGAVATTVAEVQTDTQRATVFFNSNVKVDGIDQFANLGVSLGITAKKYEYAFGPKFKFYAGYNLGLIRDSLYLGPQLIYETFQYGGVRERGSGVTLYSSKIVWIGGNLKLNIPIKSKDIFAEGNISKAFIASTSYGVDDSSIPVDGSKLSLSVGGTIYKNWGLKLTSEKLELTSVSLKDYQVSGTSTGIYLTYN